MWRARGRDGRLWCAVGGAKGGYGQDVGFEGYLWYVVLDYSYPAFRSSWQPIKVYMGACNSELTTVTTRQTVYCRHTNRSHIPTQSPVS